MLTVRIWAATDAKFSKVIKVLRTAIPQRLLSLRNEGSLAGELPVGRHSKLEQVLRTATGTSPHQFVLPQRVEAAKAAFAVTRKPITELALDLGFASSSHFSVAFRRSTGSSLSMFRKGRVQ